MIGQKRPVEHSRLRGDVPELRLVIRAMGTADWPAVRAIYHQGILTGDATFEIEVPDWQEWNSAHLEKPRLVGLASEKIVGWAALSPISGRCVYGGVAEVSVYVAEGARGQGFGKRLLKSLVEASEAAGIWTLQAGIFPENEASTAIHERCGFRLVGIRRRLGQLNGRWRDVLFMERRSEEVG